MEPAPPGPAPGRGVEVEALRTVRVHGERQAEVQLHRRGGGQQHRQDVAADVEDRGGDGGGAGRAFLFCLA